MNLIEERKRKDSIDPSMSEGSYKESLMASFNKQTLDRLVEARAKGHTLEQCAHLAGVSRSTLHRYINRGKNGEQPFQAWYRRFEKAKASSCTILLDVLYKLAIEGDRSAAFFLLERVHGFTRDGPPPLQIAIEADQVDVRAMISEYNKNFKNIIEGPTIDLDEE